MSGRYLLDTNAVINLLNRENLDQELKESNSIFFVSIITEMELLAFQNITPGEEEAIKRVLPQTGIIDISQEIKSTAIEIKKNNNIKLPDAIICATATCYNLTLVTDDQKLFGIPDLPIIHLDEFIHLEQIVSDK